MGSGRKSLMDKVEFNAVLTSSFADMPLSYSQESKVSFGALPGSTSREISHADLFLIR